MEMVGAGVRPEDERKWRQIRSFGRRLCKGIGRPHEPTGTAAVRTNHVRPDAAERIATSSARPAFLRGQVVQHVSGGSGLILVWMECPLRNW